MGILVYVFYKWLKELIIPFEEQIWPLKIGGKKDLWYNIVLNLVSPSVTKLLDNSVECKEDGIILTSALWHVDQWVWFKSSYCSVL